MTKLLRQIELNIPGSARDVTFTTQKDVRTWVDKELEIWNKFNLKEISDQRLRNHWQEQIHYVNRVVQTITAIEQYKDSDPTVLQRLQQELDNALNLIRQGQQSTRYSPWYPYIVDLWKQSPDAAALVLLASRPDGANLLGRFGEGYSFVSLVRLILRTGKGEGADEWLQPQRDELAALHNELERARDEHRTSTDQLGLAAEAQAGAEQRAVTDRENAWKAELEKVGNDWARLIKTYDEAMAMAAPSTYWSKRAGNHMWQAIAFGALFAVVLGTGFWLFFHEGMSYLTTKASAVTGQSVILALVPVVIPAFGFIWVMRMIGRLLSESLHMMRDAKERETMVKTFLAFVHDEERGKFLLLEQDRILILHALFRPSSVTSVDDSPPVHWFDLLMNKMGDKPKQNS